MNEMMKVQALIYTRPYRTISAADADYDFFAIPEGLSPEGLLTLKRHIREVMATEGAAGNIQGTRWHVFRVEDYVHVGVAKYTEREDESQRRIRGYYGLLMPCDKAFVPDEEKMCALLDEKFVNPLWMTPRRVNPYCPSCVEVPADICLTADGGSFTFNSDELKVLIAPVSEDVNLLSLLSAAVSYAAAHKAFELVYGLNNEFHALALPFMNVFCYEVNCTKEMVYQPPQLDPPEQTVSPVHEERTRSQYIPPCMEEYEFHREPEHDGKMGPSPSQSRSRSSCPQSGAKKQSRPRHEGERGLKTLWQKMFCSPNKEKEVERVSQPEKVRDEGVWYNDPTFGYKNNNQSDKHRGEAQSVSQPEESRDEGDWCDDPTFGYKNNNK